MNGPTHFLWENVTKYPQNWLVDTKICYICPTFCLKNTIYWTYELQLGPLFLE